MCGERGSPGRCGWDEGREEGEKALEHALLFFRLLSLERVLVRHRDQVGRLVVRPAVADRGDEHAWFEASILDESFSGRDRAWTSSMSSKLLSLSVTMRWRQTKRTRRSLVPGRRKMASIACCIVVYFDGRCCSSLSLDNRSCV